jgi:hypothetical protein
MAEGDHLERAITLMREVAKESAPEQQHALDRAITLVQHEVYMRDTDEITQVRLLLREFEFALSKTDWSEYKSKRPVYEAFAKRFKEAGVRDVEFCLEELVDCDEATFECCQYRSLQMSRILLIARDQYSLALVVPGF